MQTRELKPNGRFNLPSVMYSVTLFLTAWESTNYDFRLKLTFVDPFCKAQTLHLTFKIIRSHLSLFKTAVNGKGLGKII